jgi:hypothetical protein
MGKKGEEALDISYDDLATYLRTEHSVYMQVGGGDYYYLTDVNEHNWRAQDAGRLNEKGHYEDCSELVPTVNEFLALPFVDGKTIEQVFDQAVFFPSVKKSDTE